MDTVYNYYFVKVHGVIRKIHKTTVDINTDLNPCYVPLTSEQREYAESYPNATVYEVMNLSPRPEDHIVTLEEAKSIKIDEINEYDTSSSVNGFYYNGQFMWLDRDTRSSLMGTINCLEAVGRSEMNIWYKDQFYITIDTQTAKQLLYALEVYALDCYNVTASHKRAVSEMETLEEVEAFDVTSGYPQMLILGENTVE